MSVQLLAVYPLIKHVHIAAVIVSGALFMLRGVARLANAQWVMRPWLRYTSYFVDSVLLIAAVLLTLILHQYPITHTWLTLKVSLLVLYIGLGSFALKRAVTCQGRALCFLGALLVYLVIVFIARTHYQWL